MRNKKKVLYMFIDLRLYFPRVSDQSSGMYILQQFQLNS